MIGGSRGIWDQEWKGGDRAVVVRVRCFLLRGGEGSAKWVGILGSGPAGLGES